MVSVIITILKIIGILLLVILGLILILLALILFVPVCYRIQGKKEEKVEGKVTVSWLMHIISLRFSYNEELYCKLRIFGIPVYDFLKERVDSESKDKRKPNKKEKNNPEQESAAENEAEKKPILNQQVQKQEDIKDNLNESKNENKDEKKAAEESGKPEEKNESKSVKPWEKVIKFLDGIRLWIKKIIEKLHKIKYTLHSIQNKKSSLTELVEYYAELLKKEYSKRAINKLKKIAGKLWKHICPRKIRIAAVIGTNDSYTMGQIMSWYGMVYPVVGNSVRLTPVFEEEILQGTADIKGRIRIIVLVSIGWKIMFDKDIKKFYKELKREDMK